MEQPEQTGVALVEPAEIASRDLLTIDPVTYVTAVYAGHHTALALAIAAIPAEIDVTTPAGYKLATTHRATFKGIRTGANATRQQRKAPILEIGKLIDSHYKALEAEVTPYEARFDALIKDEDARKEAIKAEKARIEAERIDAIKFRIDAFGLVALDCIGKSAEHIQGAIETVTAVEIDASFEEFTTTAASAKQSALEKLDLALTSAKEAEAEQARAKAERDEFERQRKQQAADAAALAAERKRLADERAEQERKAKIQRDAESAAIAEERRKLGAARVEQERAAKTQADALAAQQAEIKRQQDELAALPKPAPVVVEAAPAPIAVVPPKLTSVATAPAPAPLRDDPEHIKLMLDLIESIRDGSNIHRERAIKNAEAFIASARAQQEAA
jgi:hypothetical protein